MQQNKESVTYNNIYNKNNLQKLITERIEEYDNLCTKSGCIDDYYKKNIIIMDASLEGKAVFDYLVKVKNIVPAAFCDINVEKQKEYFLGLPVYSVEDIQKRYDLNEITIISFTTVDFIKKEKMLEEINLPEDSYLNLYHLCALDSDFLTCDEEILKEFKGFAQSSATYSPKYDGNFWAVNWPGNGYENLAYGDFLLENIDKLGVLYDLLADDESKEVLEKYIYAMGNKCISTWERYCIRNSIVSKEMQYFVSDIIKIGDNETFIDGGSYNGAEALEFAKRSNGSYSNIVSFEPDKINYHKIKENPLIKDLKNYHILNEALFSTNKKIGFDMQDNKYVSAIKEDTDVEVMQMDAVSLDLRMKDLGIDNVSFVKMDIEGAEHSALMGAKNIITKNRPKLAICIYHKPGDLFDIPLFLKELVPGYKLFIRSHWCVCELVCYAVMSEN